MPQPGETVLTLVPTGLDGCAPARDYCTHLHWPGRCEASLESNWRILQAFLAGPEQFPGNCPRWDGLAAAEPPGDSGFPLPRVYLEPGKPHPRNTRHRHDAAQLGGPVGKVVPPAHSGPLDAVAKPDRKYPRRLPYQLFPAINFRAASATRSTTPSQAPCRLWRNSRAVGYQGVSSRPISQRQSETNGNKIHVRAPMAPAR